MTASWLATTVLALYYGILGVLSLYGVHRLVLVVVYLVSRRRAAAAIASPGGGDGELPRVTVQLPLYNEMYVARRLIDAVCRLDYPAALLEVQVLDDSSDATREVVAAAVAHHRARGVRIEHLHRAHREGFKAGALAAGLERASGELIAVFDADFVPAPDFLRRIVPSFADPGVGMVQARWEHLNRDSSLLTRIQAILLDGHFVVEHAARHRGGCFFNFNGTAGVWRRRAIVEAGGWQHDTLTEDLDLSYRAQLAGWRFVYRPEVTAPAELPVDVHGFKGQQGRWAQGAVQTCRKLLPRLLAAPLPWRVKAEAVVHLTNNLAYPLMVALAVLLFPAMVLRRGGPLPSLLVLDLPLFLAATSSVLVFYAVAEAGAGRRVGRELLRLPALMAVGIGLSASNARAVLAGLRRPGGTFVRTPKYAVEGGAAGWRDKLYRAPRSRTILVEGLLAAYLGGCLAGAVGQGMWVSLPFLWLFFQGYLYLFLLGVAPRGREVVSRALAARAPWRRLT
jgi:cellulose synthase/poly-beta-1,6-N-acetylglucosamine synthase-like glycosyltransferase